jgi:hypothetical protein
MLCEIIGVGSLIVLPVILGTTYRYSESFRTEKFIGLPPLLAIPIMLAILFGVWLTTSPPAGKQDVLQGRAARRCPRIAMALAFPWIAVWAHQAVPALIDALQDEHEAVRSNAVAALMGMGPMARDSIPALTRLREDDNERVRQHAARALEKIKTEPRRPKRF